MKLVALIKNVPDTEAKIKINADGTGIETQGVKFVMNPYDEYAVEEALLIKEALKDDSTVTVVSLGPERVVESLMVALEQVQGAYSLLLLSAQGLIAARDPPGEITPRSAR